MRARRRQGDPINWQLSIYINIIRYATHVIMIISLIGRRSVSWQAVHLGARIVKGLVVVAR